MATCNTNSTGGSFNDQFNNSSNNYVYPALSPCSGTGEDSYLEFTDKGIGIIQGSDILAKIDFSDFEIAVSSYSTETRILEGGEVIYIPGLTKGLRKKQKGFTMPYLTSTDEDLDPFFFELDLSIAYYSNFKYTYVNIDVSANYSQNVNIEDALNIAFGNSGIKVTATYDPSTLYFKGNVDGYEFSVSNVKLGIIDTSENSSSPFDYTANASTYELQEDPSAFISYSKYPNGAMQGIVMKGIYPSNTAMCPYDHWLNINHVSPEVVIYEPIEIDNFIYNIRGESIITYDPSTTFGPFISDVSIDVPDFTCDGSWAYAPSTSGGTLSATSVFQTSVSEYLIQECSILQSEIYYSVINTNASNSDIISDSSIYGSDIYPGVSGASLQELSDLFISDSSISEMSIINTFIQNSWVRESEIYDSSLACDTIYDSSMGNLDITYSIISGSPITNSNIFQTEISDSSLSLSVLKDSSLSIVDVSASQLETVDVSQCYVFQTFAKNESYFYNSQIIDSSILGSVIDSSSFVMNSSLEGIYTNAYKLWITPTEFIWVIDDPTLSIEDASSRVEIQSSTILDSSLNNVLVSDSEIYTSYIQDASIVGCTLYNVVIDTSTVYIGPDCSIFQINMTQDCSVIWDEDSSLYYKRFVKTLDVGMNGSSTPSVISAGDYLDWVTSNNYWNKFGNMYVWTSAEDGCAACENLINGFYVYNPHTFNVKIEYMIIL